MSTFAPQALKTQLQEADGAPASSPVYDDYLSHYHIDFRAFGVTQALSYIATDVADIAVHQFSPEQLQGEILVIHGYLDHHALYGTLIEHLLNKNFRVVAFDLPGHGLSGGKTASINSFNDYQIILKQVLAALKLGQQNLPLHWLGQSTGCAIINHYMLQYQPIISGQIIELAPLVQPIKWRKISLLHRLFHWFIAEVPRKFKNNSHDQAFVNFVAESDPLQSNVVSAAWLGALKQWLPVFEQLPPSDKYRPLVIQGTKDETVDWQYNLKVIENKFPQAEIHRLEGAYHQLANESQQYRQTIYQWIDERLDSKAL